MNNIDYFKSLLNENNENNDNNENNNNNICLISNEPLAANFIKLECNHGFNYLPLYNEVYQQKTKKILDNAKLGLQQIKCPYCRNISNFLLPFFKYYNTKQIKGVNSPPKLCIELYKCTHFDKKTNELCGESACITKSGCYCNKHNKTNYINDELLKNINIEDFDLYKKQTLIQLKSLLKRNNCTITGNKQQLIEKILINKHNNVQWSE